MNAFTIINAIACGIVVYCVIVRVNIIHRDASLLQLFPLWMMLIGALFEGLAPFFDGYELTASNLFLPVGLAGFMLRYVHRVELFHNKESA